MADDRPEPQTTQGRRFDPLADYTLSSEDRAAPPTGSSLVNRASTLRERQDAEVEEARKKLIAGRISPIAAPVDRVDSAAVAVQPAPDPAVWPPPIYQEAQPAPKQPEFDPLFTIRRYKSPVLMSRIVTALFGVLGVLSTAFIADVVMGNSLASVIQVFDWCKIAFLVSLCGMAGWGARAHSNMGTFHAGGLKSSSIPFFRWLYLPFVIVNDIWKGSDPRIPINPLRPLDWQYASSSPIVWLWWIVWLLTYLFYHYAHGIPLRTWCLEMGSGMILSCILTIAVVNLITTRQEDKMAVLYSRLAE